jgi:hypothetical protein
MNKAIKIKLHGEVLFFLPLLPNFNKKQKIFKKKQNKKKKNKTQ